MAPLKQGGWPRVLFGGPVGLIVLLLVLVLLGGLILAVSLVSPAPTDLVRLRSTAEDAALVLVFLAATGAVAMAIVEFDKRVLGSRRRFHREFLQAEFPEMASKDSKEFTRLINGNRLLPGDLVFDAPAETLLAYIGELAEAAVINPAIASDFLARLLRTSRDAAIARGENEQDPSLPDLPLTAADLLNKLIRPDRAEPDAMTPGASGLGDIRAEARQRIERNLDALHIALNSAWQRRIRVESSLVCGLIALVVVLRTTPGAATTVAFVVAAVIVGGPFSWFARDLVKILERRRA